MPTNYPTTLPGPAPAGNPTALQGGSWLEPLLRIQQALSGVIPSTMSALSQPVLSMPEPHVNQAPDWAKFATGANPVTAMLQGNFDLPLPDPSQMPLFNKFDPSMLLGMSGNPLMGIVQGLRAADNYFRGGKEAAAAEGPTGLPPLSFEQMQKDLGNEEEASNADVTVPFDMGSYPKPPEFEAPPGVDMEQLQGATRNSVLGALSSGAAQVDATEAGSFAKALAAAGGAGATAAGQARAGMVEVAHKNALAAYQVSMKNKEMQYEYEGEKFKMTLPDMKATDDSVVIKEYNPDKGQYEIRVIKTGGPLADADKLVKFIEAMEAPGPAAEAAGVSYLAKVYASDPAALNTNLIRMSIERTAENGAGPAVFGDKFKAADEEARNRIQPGLMTKPAEYRREYAKNVAAILLSDPDLLKDVSWLKKAGEFGSVSAQILVQGGYGQ